MADQVKTTPRGFALYADFEQRQYPGEDAILYTVQESSLASERRVWVGATGERAHLTEDEARTVRDALTKFLGDGAAHDAQVRAEAERELRDRELHHFEAEQAMAEAVAVLDSHEPGEADHLERIFKAQNILRTALGTNQQDRSGINA